MSGYGLGNLFAKLFPSALPMPKNRSQWLPQILHPLQYIIWSRGMILKKVIQRISDPVRDWLVSDWNYDKAGKVWKLCETPHQSQLSPEA